MMVGCFKSYFTNAFSVGWSAAFDGRKDPSSKRTMQKLPIIKSILAVPLILVALTSAAHAMGYEMNLNGTTLNQLLVADHPNPGIDGWTQSEANLAPDAPKAWIDSVGGRQGISFGPRFDNVSNPFSIKRDVLLNQAGSSLTISVRLTDSTTSFPERNNFFIRLNNPSGQSLFSLAFVPDTSSANPESIGSWNVITGGPFSTPFASVSGGDVYEIQFTFAANGPDIDYNVSVADETDPFNGSTAQGWVLNGANDVIGSVEFSTEIGFSSLQYGDNYMSVTDVSLVPEPSYAFLCLFVGSFAFFARRRRVLPRTKMGG